MDMFRTPELFVGKTVQKTGRTTGITSGTITGVCVRARQYSNNNPTDRVMLCQAQATYSSGGGDSGAPVYMLKTGTADIEVLIGLHWGTAFVWPNSSGVLRATFSDWYWVTSELANAVGAGGWLDPEFGACQGCGY